LLIIFIGIQWYETCPNEFVQAGVLPISFYWLGSLLDVCCELRKQRNCNNDGSRPSGQDFQEYWSNHFYDVFEETKMHEAIEEKAD